MLIHKDYGSPLNAELKVYSRCWCTQYDPGACFLLYFPNACASVHAAYLSWLILLKIMSPSLSGLCSQRASVGSMCRVNGMWIIGAGTHDIFSGGCQEFSTYIKVQIICVIKHYSRDNV